MGSEAKAVLDASAVIALLWEESGTEAVEPLLGGAVISAVNMSEVLQRYRAVNLDLTGKQQSIEALGIETEPFGSRDAEIAADLWRATRDTGLSLADRACLALARRLDLPAHTADTEWGGLAVGVKVVLIR